MYVHLYLVSPTCRTKFDSILHGKWRIPAKISETWEIYTILHIMIKYK